MKNVNIFRKTKGFTVVELLCASAISCVFVITVLVVIARFGFYGKVFKEENARTERSEQALMFHELSEIFSSKDFSKEIAVSSDKTPSNKEGSIEFKIKNVPGFLQSQNSGGGLAVTLYVDDHKLRIKDQNGQNLELVDNVNKVYLKPVWTSKHNKESLQDLQDLDLFLPSGHRRSSENIDTWSGGNQMRFCQFNLANLIKLHRKGVISRVYIVVDKRS